MATPGGRVFAGVSAIWATRCGAWWRIRYGVGDVDGAVDAGEAARVTRVDIAERVLDVVALAALFAVMTLASVAGSPVGKAPAWVALGSGLVGVVGLTLYLQLRNRGRFEQFATTIRPVARASKILTRPEGSALVGVTAFVWVLEGIVFWLVGQSLDLDLDLVGATFLVVLASFFALIPAAPGYVGTFDTAVLFGLHALKVTGGNAVAFAVLVRFVMFVPITAVGLVLLITRHGSSANSGRRAPAATEVPALNEAGNRKLDVDIR